MKAYILAVEYYLPEQCVLNEDLATQFPEWSVEKIASKTGIHKRHIAADDQLASDLAVSAAEKLFSSGACAAEDIDYILYCTQSPDYYLPSTACVIQNRLGCRNSIGALDFNLGCSAYIYGLSLAKGLIETGQVRNVLLLTAETYSKFIDPQDKTVRTIFGDGAAATYICSSDDEVEGILSPVFGTDGGGAEDLKVARGLKADLEKSENAYLYMNGPNVFTFTLRVVPGLVKQALMQAGLSIDQVDLFIFHQANQYMLQHLQQKLSIPDEKFFLALGEFGNTVSSTIPIAIAEAKKSGKLKSAKRVMLVGFGVGYSWGAVTVNLEQLA